MREALELRRHVWALKPAGANVPVDSNVYEARFVSLLRLADGVADLVRVLDAHAFDAE